MDSKTPRTKLAALALVGVFGLGLAACGDDDDTAAAPTTAAGTGEAEETEEGPRIDIQDRAFSELTVKAGETVEVYNLDGVPHTVTADDDAFDTGEIAGGDEGDFTAPDEPGSYAYHCNIHSSMQADLVVE